MWNKVIEKTVDVEVKTNLQPPSETREINSKCPKGYRLSVKKDKDNAYQKHCDEASNKNKDKAKSHNSSSTNQPQTQVAKKDKLGRWGDYLATKINAIKVAKKDKDKTKDLSHVMCYTYK